MEKEENVKSGMTSEAKKMISTFYEVQQSLEYIDDIEIGNIAIIYNNKMVEIIQLFKKNNVPLADSELRITIECYLKTLYDEAVDKLTELTKVLKKIDEINKKIYSNNIYILQRINLMMSKKVLDGLTGEKNRLLREYKEREDKIFRFDIEKDLPRIFVEERFFFDRMEEVVNRFNDGEERFINNCNIDLRNLGMKIQLPCKDQKPEKMLTLDNLNDDIPEIMYEKINSVKEKYKDFKCIETALESYLTVLFSISTIEMQRGNYEESKRLSDQIEAFDDEKDLEKSLGEFIVLSIDDKEVDEKKLWSHLRKELIAQKKEDMIDRLKEDIKNGKYEYVLELVNRELEKEVPIKAKTKGNQTQ